MEAGDESATGSVNLFKSVGSTSGFPHGPPSDILRRAVSERRRSRHSPPNVAFRRLAGRRNSNLCSLRDFVVFGTLAEGLCSDVPSPSHRVRSASKSKPLLETSTQRASRPEGGRSMEAGDESATGSVNLFNRPSSGSGHEDAADPAAFSCSPLRREKRTRARCEISCFHSPCGQASSSPYLPLSHRVRSASKSKPLPEAGTQKAFGPEGGRSVEAGDESATGSVNPF